MIAMKEWMQGHLNFEYTEELPSDSEPPILAVSYMEYKTPPSMRKFDTGATRDSEEGKLDYEAALSPLVLKRYAEYKRDCRKQPDGSMRPDDNWQKGIPLNSYMKSGWRHFFDWWYWHRRKTYCIAGEKIRHGHIEEALCALLFNVSGYLHELLKGKE